MTMITCWDTTIRGRWFSARWSRAGWLLPLSAAVLAAASDNAATARLGQGISAFRSQNYAAAVQNLRGLQTQLPKLSDHITYDLAFAEDHGGDVDAAIKDLNAYRENPVAGSPLAGKLSLLLARTLLEKRQPVTNTQATQILENDYKILPQPDGDYALAMAYEAQGAAPQSALVYQRVYYSYPNTTQAADAWSAMERLRNAIGPNFPKAPSKQQIERADKWLAAKDYFKARLEFDSLSKSLPEPERDDAKVGLAAATYLAGDYSAAFRELKALHVAKSEADAQRLYYLTEAARKTGDDSEMLNSIKVLAQKYPKSVWRLKALVTAGNRYLVANDREKYAPLYKAASDTFPEDNSTAYCHWKVTWDAYLSNKEEAAVLLREQVERYPADSRTSSALYFLGRLAEAKGEFADARAYYDRLSSQYPHYFYGVLARQRLDLSKLSAATPSTNIQELLSKVDWPVHKDLSASEPNAATKLRIDRARLFINANLADLAETEIRYGAKMEGEQPQLLALEMAQMAESPFRALRVMKSFSADYLSLPIENAPRKFWQMLFPLPYKDEVFRQAKAKGLDPYNVAALIRQESEFNPGALSHAKAYGLMQLIPSTGRMVGRQEGVKVTTAAALFNPGLNIQLGTHYLRGQLDTWSGNWEQTLAAYNAGPGRVREWLTWGTFREPAEFVESIPFSETREYVQAVLRNADMYRMIYGGSRPELPPEQLAVSLNSDKLPGVPEYGAKALVAKAVPSRSVPATHRATVNTRALAGRASSARTRRAALSKNSLSRTAAARKTNHKRPA